jgi:uncharacterized protein with PIN domain
VHIDPPVHLVELEFEGDLPVFLHRHLRNDHPVRRLLRESTSVKDVIESCGVPHTEVDLIVAVSAAEPGARAVPFPWIVRETVQLTVYPVPAPDDVMPGAPHMQPIGCISFVADGHLGKLARNLRLLGFDTAYEPDASDRRLLEIMQTERRALLTRDRRLLMHSIVEHGYCPRSTDAETQTREVLLRFDLAHRAADRAAFTRCLLCNGLLEPVSNSAVAGELADEPLTLRWHESFFRCASCARIYWPGTHFEKLAARVGRLTAT